MENRNIYLFASGKAVSILGSSIFSFAIGLYVLKLTGSALNYAMTLMLSVIPMVVISPIAGVIADRVSKKWLVSGMDFINSILFAALFILSIYRELTLPVIYIAPECIHYIFRNWDRDSQACACKLREAYKDKLTEQADRFVCDCAWTRNRRGSICFCRHKSPYLIQQHCIHDFSRF